MRKEIENKLNSISEEASNLINFDLKELQSYEASHFSNFSMNHEILIKVRKLKDDIDNCQTKLNEVKEN